MTEPEKKPETKEAKKPRELRDLKPAKDVIGGARKTASGEKRPPPKTGEIDFMNWD
ncbi:MAG TPA: hypothetical protein VGL24_04330 [Chthoniobacterales bacterium]|jgi:hypothetical protein